MQQWCFQSLLLIPTLDAAVVSPVTITDPDPGCSKGVPSHYCIVLLGVDVTRTKQQNKKQIPSSNTAAPCSHLPVIT